MSQSLLLVFLITLVGMGLVFLLIIILWGFMALLTRIFVVRENPDELLQQQNEEEKYKAAIFAVAMALAKDSVDMPHEFPLPPTALVSAWQAVMRSNIITKRGRIR